MKKLYLLTLLAVFGCAFGLKAQVTTEPSPLQEDSQNVWIYFHADQGNKGLAGLNANSKIYAHTGVITNKSTSSSDWKYTIADWKVDTEKAQLTYVSTNLWKLYIGDIRTYYGITDMQEKIQKLAFVFRTSGGSKEGKTASGGDILVDVVDPGLQVEILSSLEGNIVDSQTGKVTFTANTTSNANITISVNGTNIKTGTGTTLSADYTFPSVGDYTITATATSGNESSTSSLMYAYFSNPTQQNYPGGTPIMGPVTNSDGSVTFCIAAPEMSRVVIRGSWNDYLVTNNQQLYYQDFTLAHPFSGESGTFRYFWITIPDIAKTNDQYVYFFQVQGIARKGNNTMTVNTTTCDPYARLVLDPWNDKYIDTDVYPDLPAYPYDVTNEVPVAVYQKNMNEYNWQCTDFERPEQTDLMIYELLFRDFTGTEGKAEGNGTVNKAIEKFEYLKNLGVNAIELLPICDFSGNLSWGYNPNFYFAPDKAYGTPDDYKNFIDLCHQNGIAVILDVVFNQSDGLHPWYQIYGGITYSPFYNSGYGGENGAPHAYSVMNDWNQGYPLVQQQWKDVLTYWLTEYKFDGFRFDLVKGLGLNSSYANAGDAATNAKNLTRVQEMKYLNSVIQEVAPGAYCINENLAGAEEENLMAEDNELNWANVNKAGCQFAMGYSSDSNMNRLNADQDSRLWGSTVSYLESHDEERMAYKQDMWAQTGIKGNAETSCQRLGSAAAQMILAPGSHMIWMFGELGKSESLEDRTGNKVVEWSLLDEPNHKGLYQNYCDLISIRFRNPQFFTRNNAADIKLNCNTSTNQPDTYWGNGQDPNPRSIILKANGEELIMFLNPNCKGGSKTYSYSFTQKSNDAYEILAQSYNSNPRYDASNGTITIEPNCFVVIGSANVKPSGIDGIAADDNANTLRVFGGNGEIVIDYAVGGATVFSLDGKVIGSVAESGSLSATPGLYIVKCGKKAVKVVVR